MFVLANAQPMGWPDAIFLIVLVGGFFGVLGLMIWKSD